MVQMIVHQYNNNFMNSFSKQLTRLDKLLKANFGLLYEKLLDPLTEEQIRNHCKRLGIDVPEFVEIFLWKNGLPNNGEYSTQAYAYCSFGAIPPLEYINEIHELHLSIGIWPDKLIPLVTDYGGNFLLLDISIESPTYGMILLECPTFGNVGDNRLTYYDSIYNMVETINECIEKGGFIYDRHNLWLNVDNDIVFEISTRLNPKSKYWDEYRK